MLCYFHKKNVTSGNLDGASGNNRVVTICIRYNSRFPRPMERTMIDTARPASGSARELVLKPGQILVYGSRSFVEYPAGTDGSYPTDPDPGEGLDGGFAIVLVYSG
jgi:hypothetical protein